LWSGEWAIYILVFGSFVLLAYRNTRVVMKLRGRGIEYRVDWDGMVRVLLAASAAGLITDWLLYSFPADLNWPTLISPAFLFLLHLYFVKVLMAFNNDELTLLAKVAPVFKRLI
ncbi:MAG: hypothetical protein ACRERU_19780, partial [Methylococcales bacterium]